MRAGASAVFSGLRPVALPLGATLAVQAAISLAVMSVPVLAPVMAADLGVAATWIGYYAGVLYLAASFASAEAPRVLTRIGPLTVSLGCVLLAALGLGVIGVDGLLAAAVGTVLLGLGYGPANPASTDILAPRTPDTVWSLVFSLKQTGVPLGGALAGILVPPLLLLWGWRGAALALVGLCALLVLALWPLRPTLDPAPPDAAKAARSGGGSSMGLVLRDPPLRRLAFASFTFSAMQVSLTSFLVVQLVERAGLDLLAAGPLLSAALGAGIAGRILWGWVADRFRARRRVLIGLALAMSSLALAAGAIGPGWPVPLILALCIALGGTAIAWNGVFMAEVIRRAPPGLGSSATGGTLAITFLGVVAGPPLFGLLVQLSDSYAVAYAALAALTLTGGWLVWRAR
jgi:MFS family permease